MSLTLYDNGSIRNVCRSRDPVRNTVRHFFKKISWISTNTIVRNQIVNTSRVLSRTPSVSMNSSYKIFLETIFSSLAWNYSGIIEYCFFLRTPPLFYFTIVKIKLLICSVASNSFQLFFFFRNSFKNVFFFKRSLKFYQKTS